jgi:hypothetical protein
MVGVVSVLMVILVPDVLSRSMKQTSVYCIIYRVFMVRVNIVQVIVLLLACVSVKLVMRVNNVLL